MKKILISFLLLFLPLALAQHSHGQSESTSESQSHDDDHDHDHDDDHDHDHDHDHDDDHDHDHEHHHDHGAHDLRGRRLLVSDGVSTDVYVLDLYTGNILGTFSTPGVNSRVYSSASGRFGLALDRDANRVSIIHSGLNLVDHGDHFDLLEENPYIVATLNVGRQPTHFWAHGNEVVIFNDQEGTIAILDERLFGLRLDFTEIRAAQPDHGAAVMLGDYVLSGHLALDHVDVYSRDNDLVTTFEGCPRLHGQATLENVAAFGCSDGVLLIMNDGGDLRSVKLENPANSPENARVGTLVAHEDSRVMIGNFGSGFAIIHLDDERLETVELPIAPHAMRFSGDGEHLFILTRDGQLHALEPETGEVIASISALEFPTADGVTRPGVVVSGDIVLISNPLTGEILEFSYDHDEFTRGRHLSVAGVPGNLSLLALEGGTIH